MIGENTVILNEETVKHMVEGYLKNSLFKEGEFSVTKITKKSYDTEWRITLEGKEAADATEG